MTLKDNGNTPVDRASAAKTDKAGTPRQHATPDIARRTLLAGAAGIAGLAGSAWAQSPKQKATPMTNDESVTVHPRKSPPILVSFIGGSTGTWKVDRVTNVIGEGLALASRMEVVERMEILAKPDTTWLLRGTTSNSRYSTRKELDELAAHQEGLGRPTSTLAALIPIRKTEAWWALGQDQRRAIFQEQSHHFDIGFEYLPAISRRLHHSRELGEEFDFLTWFEYDPQHSDAFETLVLRLRATPEWGFVDREVDIRLSRA
jgi:hypothetical protein